MTRVMLIPNELYEDSVEDARLLENWLDEEGVDVVRPPNYGFDEGADLSGVDLVVSLGGDGTLLRAAHLVGSLEIPILGLSYGHLGFLTYDDAGNDVRASVAAALAGDLHKSRRATIEVRVTGDDGRGNSVERVATALNEVALARGGSGKMVEFDVGESRRATIEVRVTGDDGRGNSVERVATALNEVALARGGSGKMVEFDVGANGVHIDRLRGDGFVVATATGSTGYALSAGGPIVTPDFGGMVCVPIAPHTITARAFLTSASDVVELSVVDDRSSDRVVFADGEPLFSDLVPERLQVVRGAHDVVLLTDAPESFFTSVSRVFYGKVR